MVTIDSNPLNDWGGWKVPEHVPLNICSDYTEEQYFKCMERDAFYSIDEIITLNNTSRQYFNNQSFYTVNMYGLAYSLMYNNTKIVPTSSMEKLWNLQKIDLNPKMWYSIRIFDPRLSYFSFNPDTIQRPSLKVTEGVKLIFLYLKVIELSLMSQIPHIHVHDAKISEQLETNFKNFISQ